MRDGYQPLPVGEFNPIKSPKGGTGAVKPCEHKFIYLGQRRVKDEYSQTTNMTKMVDVFYCEKCLKYEYRDC